MTAPVLQVDALSFSYPGRHVFTGWHHAFGPGVSWVRGSNGSGKSTLLKLLVGALPALTLRLTLNGRASDPATAAHRQQVYWCGPGAVAFDHLRPDEFFGFLRGLYPRFDSVGAQELAAELGLTPFLGRRLSEMSTGTQRKVWLSAAFNAGTPVVLLDEPLNALDLRSVRVVRERLARCAADPAAAWIVVSHEGLGDAEAQASTVTLTEAAEP